MKQIILYVFLYRKEMVAVMVKRSAELYWYIVCPYCLAKMVRTVCCFPR